MLTATDVHYIVGILTQLSAKGQVVDIELGERVHDDAAKKKRDVDITIKYRDDDGNISSFHGIEVKKHGRPLTLEHVEQICLKLKDMSEITHRFLVSATGYTADAPKKAAQHGLQLLDLLDWDGRGMNVDMSQAKMAALEVSWQQPVAANPVDVKVLSGPPLSETESIQFGPDLTGFFSDDPDNKVQYGAFLHQVASFVLNGLARPTPMTADEVVGTIQVDQRVNLATPLNIDLAGRKLEIPAIVIRGTVEWKRTDGEQHFKVLVPHGQTDPMAGCAITELTTGELVALLVSKDGVHFKMIPVDARTKKKINRMKFDRMQPD